MTDFLQSQPPRSRRDFLRVLGIAIGTSGLRVRTASALPASPLRAITVYKDPDCGCCAEWVKHIRKAGFITTVNDMRDLESVKRAMGVPKTLESCHTARIGSYIIEGHVPADVIIKMLTEKPDALGLAVPGMPMGSPGMEGARLDRYNVMLFDKAGASRIYASR